MSLPIQIADGSGATGVYGLLAGRSNVGKTTRLTDFPKEETLGISVEKGFLSIEGSGYAYVECDTYDQILHTLTNLPSWVKYVLVDSLSEIYDKLRKELDTQFTSSQNFQKFEQMNIRLFHLIRVAKQITGKSIFFTCHTKEDKNGLTLEENLAFDGKMPEDLKKQFDLIVHMNFVKFENNPEPVRAFITNPAISKIAKRRTSPWLKVQLEDYEEPNLFKLTQKLLGKGA